MIRLTVARIAIAFSLLMALFVVLRPLLPVDETRYLAVAWEMRLSGDLLHLTRNFDPYSHKPPLLFWLINLVWLPGLAGATGRAVGPACAVAALVATAALARQFWRGDRGTPVRAAAVLGGFSVFAAYGSLTMFDALLTLAVLGGIAALWRIGTGRDQGRAWLGFALAVTVGLYAKGPVILIHLLPGLVLIRVWAPAVPPAQVVTGKALLALLGAGALFGLWVLAAVAHSSAQYEHEFLWTQSVSRMAGGFAHDRPAWFFLALLPVLMFPWGWTPGLWRGLPKLWRADPAARLSAVWSLGAFVVFSLMSSKQPHYLLPELPAVALVFGRMLGPRAGLARVRGFAPWPVLAVSLALAVLLWLAPDRLDLPEPLTPGPAMALALTMAGLAVVALAIPVLPGHLALGWGATLALHILFAVTGLAARYDARPLAAALQPARSQGLAAVGFTYSAEVNFALRLTGPVATPATPEDLRVWAIAHPGGLAFGPVEGAPITAPPDRRVVFRNRTYGIWSAAKAELTAPG